MTDGVEGRPAVRICGVDPGVQVTGYGVVDVAGSRCSLVVSGALRSAAAAPLAARLRVIHEGIRALVQTTRPDVLVLEALYSHYAHPTTAILMGHVRGVILLAAGESGLPTASYPATHIKKAVTGRGHATKAQIQRMVQMLLRLPDPPEPEDATDALAVAMAHAHTLRAPLPEPARSSTRGWRASAWAGQAIVRRPQAAIRS